MRVDLDEDGMDDIVVTDVNDNGQMDLLISSGMDGNYDTLLLDVEIDEEGNLVLDDNGIPVHEGAYEVNAHLDIVDVEVPEDEVPSVDIVDNTPIIEESPDNGVDNSDYSSSDYSEYVSDDYESCYGTPDYDPSEAADEALLDLLLGDD